MNINQLLTVILGSLLFTAPIMCMVPNEQPNDTKMCQEPRGTKRKSPAQLDTKEDKEKKAKKSSVPSLQQLITTKLLEQYQKVEVAINYNENEKIKKLLDKYPDVINLPIPESSPFARIEPKLATVQPLLITAALQGNVAATQELLARDVDITLQRRETGSTAYQYAKYQPYSRRNATPENMNTIAQLLKEYAQKKGISNQQLMGEYILPENLVDKLQKMYDDPEKSHKFIIGYLDATSNETVDGVIGNEDTFLSFAIGQTNVPLIRELLRRGAQKVNASDVGSAARDLPLDIATQLLAKIKPSSDDLECILNITVFGEKDEPKLISLILEKGPISIEILDNALEVAKIRKHYLMAEQLLEHGIKEMAKLQKQQLDQKKPADKTLRERMQQYESELKKIKEMKR